MRSLHARLAIVLLTLLLLAGVGNLYVTLEATDLYLHEVNQEINLDLAGNIARMKHTRLLTEDGELRENGLDELFHWMMVVNPGPHFYLLDLEGRVLAFDPAAGEVLQPQVALNPIRDFLASQDPDEPTRAILGDDPRAPSLPKVFSASPIPAEGEPLGYLYIVLAGHHVDSAAERLRESYILRLSTQRALAYLAVVLLTGLLAFGYLTRPLRRLAIRMRSFRHREDDPATRPSTGDELRLLNETFSEMSERIENQVEEIEHMERSRRELIGNVSHDLRTPLALLRGYLETLSLKDKTFSDEEREKYIRIATGQSERLGRLVDELFELTRLDAKEVLPKMERIQLGELVQDNVQHFQLQAEQKNVRLRAEFDADLPLVQADMGLMARVLENLLGNALRYTPAGGLITVRLREMQDRLRVQVSDTGCGIPESDLPRIFDRYYRARSSKGESGSGLGLAITQRILELHGSTPEIESRPEHGTTISFSLAAA